jgi:hypothetical protein
MTTDWLSQHDEQNLPLYSRVFRISLGLGLILFTMLAETKPLGWLAVLPLVAIYPMLTGLEGWDPIKYALQSKGLLNLIEKAARPLTWPTRLAFGVFGAALLGIVMLSPASITADIAWVALAAVYPVFIAITGAEPITALFTSRNRHIGGYNRQSDTHNRNIIAPATHRWQSLATTRHDRAA